MPDLAKPSAGHALRVLLIDAEPLSTRPLTRILHRMPDVTVLGVCTTVESGLTRIAEGDVDLVIAELNFPLAQGSGSAILHHRAPNGPMLVFYTAYTHDAQSLIDQGALEVLSKPQDPGDIGAMVTRAQAARSIRTA